MKQYVAYIFVVVLSAGLRADRTCAQDMPGMDMSTHKSDKPFTYHWGLHAVLLGSRVSPAVADSTIIEGYITQPSLMGGLATRNGALSLTSTISLEGLTLKRGELGPGNYGEGYTDRRHPHTYLHELVATAHANLPAHLDASLSAGRGFAPFGTDDPMMRPFVRFPVNHHLSQVLERLIVIGGIRRGPVTFEAGIFSGNEPLSPKAVGDLDRFGDSWSTRVTIRPTASWEIQASRAFVNSPEEPMGQGHDQRKISGSARHDGMVGQNHVYALVEAARSTVIGPRGDVYATASVLAEASLERSSWSAALRLENTKRAEELREGNFRTPWPPSEDLVIGFTKWRIASIRAEHSLHYHNFAAAPFIETSLAHVTPNTKFDLFQPREFYGSNNLWSLSIGMRLNLGMQHDRMGRYGVALPATRMSMAGM